MGLNVSHDCWNGSYRGFTLWRNTVAEAAGYRIVRDSEGYPSADLRWDMYTDGNFQGEWDAIPEDPLLLLIVHSDCDGIIKAEHAPWLADRLEELIPKLRDDAEGHVLRYRELSARFVAGLRRAAAAGEDVEFG